MTARKLLQPAELPQGRLWFHPPEVEGQTNAGETRLQRHPPARLPLECAQDRERLLLPAVAGYRKRLKKSQRLALTPRKRQPPQPVEPDEGAVGIARLQGGGDHRRAETTLQRHGIGTEGAMGTGEGLRRSIPLATGGGHHHPEQVHFGRIRQLGIAQQRLGPVEVSSEGSGRQRQQPGAIQLSCLWRQQGELGSGLRSQGLGQHQPCEFEPCGGACRRWALGHGAAQGLHQAMAFPPIEASKFAQPGGGAPGWKVGIRGGWRQGPGPAVAAFRGLALRQSVRGRGLTARPGGGVIRGGFRGGSTLDGIILTGG